MGADGGLHRTPTFEGDHGAQLVLPHALDQQMVVVRHGLVPVAAQAAAGHHDGRQLAVGPAYAPRHRRIETGAPLRQAGTDQPQVERLGAGRASHASTPSTVTGPEPTSTDTPTTFMASGT